MTLIFAFIFLLIFPLLILPLIFKGAPYLPTIRFWGTNKEKDLRELKRVINKLNSLNFKNCNFIDLGCGDARIILEFAKYGYNCLGIEINPILFLMGWLKIKLNKQKNCKIVCGNFWNVDLSPFNIIYFFHHSYFNKIFENKFLKEASDNSILISCAFPFKNLELLDRIGDFYIYSKKEASFMKTPQLEC